LFISKNPSVSLAGKLLDSLSPDLGSQIWIISEASDGWFSLKSFIHGYVLGLDAARNFVFGRDVSANKKENHWKFVQDVVGTNIALVNRTALSDNLGVGDGERPRVSQRTSNDLNQRWQVVAHTGRSSDLRLAAGVYTITSYVPPNPYDMAARATSLAGVIDKKSLVLKSAPQALQILANK
jgi:hypothetical protein